MIFILMVLVILTFVVLYNFDLHKILHTKSKAQNAGDSAAVMGARWQAITLNLIGDLNIMNAAALSIGDSDTASSINSIQSRLCFVGPMIGLFACQQSAKQNGIYVNDDFTDEMQSHADEVRYDYPSEVNEDGDPLFPQPFTDAWEEYADMIEAVANAGVAAAPDSVVYYSDSSGGHVLYNEYFYSAIEGYDWCWFYNNEPDLLEDYTTFEYWDELPEISTASRMNSEFFGLMLSKHVTSLNEMDDGSMEIYDQMIDIADERDLEAPTTNVLDMTATWFVYDNDTNAWSTAWDRISSGSGEDAFPAVGEVRDQYAYQGPDAVIRIEATDLTLLTPDSQAKDIIWTAAAKPFGSLNNEQTPPNSYEIVLPAFHHARLIALDASSSLESGGSYDIGWRRHQEEHLPYYIQYGPNWIDDAYSYSSSFQSDPTSCSYCNNLITWEDADFRETGVEWLSSNSYLCTITTGGSGGGSSGGTSRGH